MSTKDVFLQELRTKVSSYPKDNGRQAIWTKYPGTNHEPASYTIRFQYGNEKHNKNPQFTVRLRPASGYGVNKDVESIYINGDKVYYTYSKMLNNQNILSILIDAIFESGCAESIAIVPFKINDDYSFNDQFYSLVNIGDDPAKWSDFYKALSEMIDNAYTA